MDSLNKIIRFVTILIVPLGAALVIKEINFATYNTELAQFHFMNIVTLTSNVESMTWNGNSIKSHFHRIRGNSEYSFARIQIISR